MMDRVHCNNCNVEVGHKPPFFVGDITWYGLEVFGKEYDYCLKCKLVVEKKVNILLSNILKDDK